MEKRVVIVHSVKHEGEIKKIKELAKEKFPGCTVVSCNFSSISDTDIKAFVSNANAVIVSVHGRLIIGSSVVAVLAAKTLNVPTYFVISLNHDGLDGYKAQKWAYTHAGPGVFKGPVITELNLKDETCAELYGQKVIVLPTYAM